MRLIDADLLEAQFGISDEDLLALDEIRHAPTVDAVIVTRCKDCKHSCKDGNGRTCEGYWYELSEYAVPVKDDAFCSYGEPKEGAE